MAHAMRFVWGELIRACDHHHTVRLAPNNWLEAVANLCVQPTAKDPIVPKPEVVI